MTAAVMVRCRVQGLGAEIFTALVSMLLGRIDD